MIKRILGFLDKKPTGEYQDLTQHELQALKMKYNLADAHTHQSQSPSQREIVARLPQLWYEAEQTTQAEMEQRFIETFFRTQNQNYALNPNNGLLVYAASIAMVIIANYLMKKKMSVALMHPCFDNLHDILKNMQINPKPLQESWLHDTEKIYENLKKNVKEDAIFLVDPNNPTGFTLFSLGRKGYEEVLRYAKDHNKLVLIDYCFASFMLSDKNLEVFDVYEMLEKSGVSYITVEDTGKTWPLQDAKAAILKCSQNLYEEVYNIHTSYLLNVSPFILNLLTQYILDSEKDGFASVYNLLDTNRDIVRNSLKGSLLEFQEPIAQVSVAWCKITDPNIKATELQDYIMKSGIYVLPGTYFYWNDRSEGEKYIRIALARNTDVFSEAIKILRESLDKYQHEN